MQDVIYISRNFNKSLDLVGGLGDITIYISRNFNKSLDISNDGVSPYVST